MLQIKKIYKKDETHEFKWHLKLFDETKDMES
jgi:hypothetical protein